MALAPTGWLWPMFSRRWHSGHSSQCHPALASSFHRSKCWHNFRSTVSLARQTQLVSVALTSVFWRLMVFAINSSKRLFIVVVVLTLVGRSLWRTLYLAVWQEWPKHFAQRRSPQTFMSNGACKLRSGCDHHQLSLFTVIPGVQITNQYQMKKTCLCKWQSFSP